MAEYEELKQLKARLDLIVVDVAPNLAGVSDVDAFEGELRNMSGTAIVRSLDAFV